MIGRSTALAALVAMLVVPVASAGGPPEHAQARGHKELPGRGREAKAQAQHGNAAGLDDCVRVKRAGRSGKFQVRGNGVHLVLGVEDRAEFREELGDLDAGERRDELNGLAESIADAICDENTAAAALAAAENLNLDFAGLDLEIVHQNTYGPTKSGDEAED